MRFWLILTPQMVYFENVLLYGRVYLNFDSILSDFKNIFTRVVNLGRLK